MLIAGNWKMYTTPAEARALAEGVVAAVDDAVGDALEARAPAVHVAVCPPFVCLPAVAEAVRDTPVRLGAQTMHAADEGAYTGETAAPMLRDVGCRYVILGHSERRQYFGETDAEVNAKVKQAWAHGLTPIVCVGETLQEREGGRAEAVVRAQVEGALDGCDLEDAARLVLAYEPVWAIGTGESATPEQAQAMHAAIRRLLEERFGRALGDGVHLLYGGSMKPHNAAELLGQPDINGGLIGSASLEAASFAAIAEAGAEAVAAG